MRLLRQCAGHKLGRIIYEGNAIPNTGIPGAIAGVAKERVIHAECAGVLYGEKKISDYVQKDEVIAYIYPDAQAKDASGQREKDGEVCRESHYFRDSPWTHPGRLSGDIRI